MRDVSKIITPSEFRFGWAGEYEALKQWDMLGDRFSPFFIAGQRLATQKRTFRAWDVVRKIRGSDLITIPQDTGDCVGMSTADLLMVNQYLEIAAGESEEYHPIFCPFGYAVGRVLIGKKRLGSGPGSIGSWQALGAQQHGVLRADYAGVPEYSGDISDLWGNDKGNWRTFLPEARLRLVRTVSRIISWTQLIDSICNGYLCTIASSLGFENRPRKDGFHYRRGTWEHQMGIWGISDDPAKPWVAIHNQWGNMHGEIVDFETGEKWPTGMLRVRPEDIESAYKNGEIMAYSQFDGYPDRSDNWQQWSML